MQRRHGAEHCEPGVDSMTRSEIGRSAWRSQAGVTLIELLVVMIIMAIVSTMIVGTWLALSRSYAVATQSSEQRDNAQMAIERLTRELRDAQGLVVGDSVISAILATDLGPNEVLFNTAFNMTDAAVPTSAPRLVRYYLLNGTLYRQLAGSDRVFGADDPSRSIVDHVVNASEGADLFRYYWYNGSGDLVNSSGTSDLPTDPARVKEIKINLLVDLRPGHSPDHMQITTMVQPRNQRNF